MKPIKRGFSQSLFGLKSSHRILERSVITTLPNLKKDKERYFFFIPSPFPLPWTCLLLFWTFVLDSQVDITSSLLHTEAPLIFLKNNSNQVTLSFQKQKKQEFSYAYFKRQSRSSRSWFPPASLTLRLSSLYFPSSTRVPTKWKCPVFLIQPTCPLPAAPAWKHSPPHFL